MSHEEDEDPLKKEDFYLDLQVSEEDEDHITMLQQDAIFAACPACMQKTRSDLGSLCMTALPAWLPAGCLQSCLRDLVPASTV